MKVALTPDDLVEAVQTAQSEAQAAFGNGAVYMERYLQKPRHIELQVIADSPEPVPCCGGCRQKIAEFAAPDVVVTLGTTDGKEKRMTVADLLPGVFTMAHMDRA